MFLYTYIHKKIHTNMYLCKWTELISYVLLTLTSANVVIFRHNESSPNIEIICEQLTFDEMQMRHNCKLLVNVGVGDVDSEAASDAVAAAAAVTVNVVVSILMTIYIRRDIHTRVHMQSYMRWIFFCQLQLVNCWTPCRHKYAALFGGSLVWPMNVW